MLIYYASGAAGFYAQKNPRSGLKFVNLRYTHTLMKNA